MVPNFPSPVLSVAADALKDLDGRDALSGLWTIFTKCKESLQDGRRLENISWRLWYRELALQSASLPSSPDSPPSSPYFNANTGPLTPVSEKGDHHASLSPHPPSRPVSPISANGSNGASKRLSFSSTTSSVGRPLSILSKYSSPVGKIICDMIPDKLDVTSVKQPAAPALRKADTVVVTADSATILVAPIPSMLLPPSTPPSTVGVFPRVVVVNPTPHPTPPATPVPLGPPAPLPPAGQHLAPPPRLSTAATRHAPDTAPPQINQAPAPRALAPISVVAAALQPQPPHPTDETLKAPDRRFFLQQDQSPSPERDGRDHGSAGSISTGKSPSETGEILASSVTSNQTRASATSTSSRRTGRGRRSKDTPARPAMTRLNSGRHAPQVQRRDSGKTKAPLAIHTEKAKIAGPSRATRSPLDHQPPTKARQPNGTVNGITPKAPQAQAPPPPAAAAPAAPRRGIVMSNSSSEYETTDTDDDDDDDSWASEDISEGAEVGTAQQAPTKEEIRLREAALEAQRQRDLFVKQPKRSYSGLGRTQSGLLSQLLNPDPNMLPPGHPFRVSSAHDLTRTASKSSASLPQAAQVTAQAPIAATMSSGPHGGYRPKGRPQGEELEDESDSPDDPDDTIQVSRSLAQQRLAALADPLRRRASDTHGQSHTSVVPRPVLPTVATAPIPLNHPWNLPAPAPPTTPRTTRRQMLATELSESLRRNLLWERQVSKTNLLGNGRRNVGLSGGMRPLTTMGGNGNAQAGPSQQQQQRQQSQHQQQGQGAAEDSMAERRRRALARNRTWADDFHYAGW
ncbi:hypothetical protein BC834DRAFT_1044630 [Gloeopeniophorella convolvens]|nr:hypothetical protein BC834DRAFT_1044630 [Gloeopeniophorella convolvens]